MQQFCFNQLYLLQYLSIKKQGSDPSNPLTFNSLASQSNQCPPPPPLTFNSLASQSNYWSTPPPPPPPPHSTRWPPSLTSGTLHPPPPPSPPAPSMRWPPSPTSGPPAAGVQEKNPTSSPSHSQHTQTDKSHWSKRYSLRSGGRGEDFISLLFVRVDVSISGSSSKLE